MCFLLVVRLPWKWFPQIEIAAGRPVGGKRGELRAGFGSLGNLEFGVWPTHIRLHPARVRGVDLYRGLAQLVGEMDRESIQRRFRCIVGKDFVEIYVRARIRVEGEGPENAREIHDSPGRGLADQGQKRLRECYGTKEIRFEGLAQDRG